MSQVQDRSLDLLTCNPVHYHWAIDAPLANEMNFAPGAGSLARLVDLQSSTMLRLPLHSTEIFFYALNVRKPPLNATYIRNHV